MVLVKAQQPKLMLPIGHIQEVNTANFSPNGKLILTSSGDNTAKIWDAQSGALLADLKGGYNAYFSPDGKKIAIASLADSTAKIWDAMNCNLLANLKGHIWGISSDCFSPDSKKIVAISFDSTAGIWDAGSGTLLTKLRGHTDFVWSATFSPDGKKIVTTSADSSVKIWDVQSGTILVNITGQKSLDSKACFLPGSKKIITSATDGTPKIWDAQSGVLLTYLKGSGKSFGESYLSNDGKRVATISSDSTTVIWDALSGTISLNIKGHTGPINFACFSPDNKKIVTASKDNTAKIWNVQNGVLLGELKVNIQKEYSNWFKSACFSPDGKKILTTGEDAARIWDAIHGTVLADLNGHANYVSGVYFSSNGKKMITSTLGNSAQIWDASTGMLISNLKGNINLDLINSGCFSPDGKKVLMISWDSTAKIWDAESGTLLFTLKGHSDVLGSACFSPDGKKVLTTSDGNSKLWDAQNGILLADLKEQTETGSLNDACFSPDGKKIFTFDDNVAQIWNAESGVPLAKLKGYSGYNVARFSPDSKRIITASNQNNISIWDATSGSLLIKHEGHKTFSSPYISPDTKEVISYYDGGFDAKILNTQSGTLIAELNGHTAGINSVSFSPDSKKLITVSDDNTAKIWDIQSGRLLSDLKGHNYWVVSACFSPDGRKIATASLDHTVKIWDANKGVLQNSFLSIDSSDYFVQIPSGYYQCTPNAAKLLHYVDKNLRVITFEQLDIKYNRPDLVLNAIESPDTSLIHSYKKAWQKRIKKLGFDTISFIEGGLQVPEADIVNRDSIQYDQTSSRLSLKISTKDDSIFIDRINVWINEVPLFGVRGISLRNKNIKQFDTTITVILSNGANRIETSVTNVGGLESYRIPLDVKYSAPQGATEKLYFIGLGIDHFYDSRYNLSWSVKDIRDLARSFKKKYGKECIIDTLFDKDLSIQNVETLKRALLVSNENDKVIIAYSGHGLLSKDYDYFLSTYNVNFQEPEKGGLPYESLEDLLDGIPARKKLMFIDACHSGEVDKEELSKMVLTQIKLDSTKKGVIVLVDTANKRLGTKNSFELMQQAFVNVGRSTGATIISAASGTQYALERGDLKNGVFTYSILELMNSNPTITVSDLKKYVNQRVTVLTNGMQVPTSRNENLVMDWRVW